MENKQVHDAAELLKNMQFTEGDKFHDIIDGNSFFELSL